MWRTSPDGFSPVVRVSLLDLVQSRSLQRSARQMQAEGKLDEAIMAWRQAIASNPGDVEANRGFIRALCAGPKPTS